eukprot:1936759-Pyramimonas_sp.AAC.1
MCSEDRRAKKELYEVSGGDQVSGGNQVPAGWSELHKEFNVVGATSMIGHASYRSMTFMPFGALSTVESIGIKQEQAGGWRD